MSVFVFIMLLLVKAVCYHKPRVDCLNSIGRPATLAAVLNARCNSDDIRSTPALLADVLAKLSRHENDKKILPGTVDLFSLVKDITTMMNKDLKRKRGRFDAIPRFFRRFRHSTSLCTSATIDDISMKDLAKKKKALEEHIKTHQKLTTDLQKAQRKCWISEDRVTKYTLMLTTSESSKENLREQLSRRELKRTDRAISDFKKSLKQKQAAADHDAIVYSTLVHEEEMARQRIEKLSLELRQEIQFDLMDRLENSLCALSDLADAFLDTASRDAFYLKMQELDIKKVISAVVSDGQIVYTCVNPTKYTQIHGIAKKIPAGKISKKC